MYIHVAPGQGQSVPRGQNFDVNRKALSLYPFVASFKETSLKSDFVLFFHDLMHVYRPGAGAIQTPGGIQPVLFILFFFCFCFCF